MVESDPAGALVMVTRRSTIPLALLLVATILAACGGRGERCGYDFHAGGEFTITLSGDVDGQATGQGLDPQNLERWLANTPGWNDIDHVWGSSGITGGLCASHVVDEQPCAEGFAGSVGVPGGTFVGAEEATYVGVRVGREGFMDVSLLKEGEYSAGIWPGAEFRQGLQGGAHGVPLGPEGFTCATEPGWPCYFVDVTWSLDPDVTAQERWACEYGF